MNKKKIKVLHCIETMGSGGVEQLKYAVSKHIDTNTFDQVVVCSKVKNNFDHRFKKLGIPVYPIGELKKLYNLPYYWRLIRRVRKEKPDILHGAVFEGVISAVLAGIICRIPVIIIEETSEPLNRSSRGSRLLKFLASYARWVIAISPSVKTYLHQVAGIPEEKIKLINYAVDKPEPPSSGETNELKESLGITADDFVIGSVGRLRDFHKRFSDLIKAAATLRDACPGLKLLIVGDGEDMESLKTLAKQCQMEDRVIFAGYQSNTTLYYSCMDAFALVSHMEAFGLVVVEAMFMKLPVIVTAVGGMKDIVINGTTGLLVQPHDLDAIAAAIKTLYNDREQGIAFGQAGYVRAGEYYSVQQHAREVQDLYLSSLKSS